MFINTNKLKRVTLDEILSSRAKKEYFIASTHTTYYGDYESSQCYSDIPEELNKLEKEGKIIQLGGGVGHYHFITYLNNNRSYYPVNTGERPVNVTADGFSLILKNRTSYAILDKADINSLSWRGQTFSKNMASEKVMTYLGEILSKTKTERNKDLVKLRKIARKNGQDSKLNDIKLILAIDPEL